MKVCINPSAVDLEKLKNNAYDLASLLATDKKIVVEDYLYDGSGLSLNLVGLMTGDSISVSTWGQHSLGFSFTDDKDLEALIKLIEGFAVPSPEWTVTNPVKNDRLYLKLKTKNNQYVMKSNIKLNAKKPETAPLGRYQQIEAQVDVKMYYSLENKTCGFYLDLFNLHFKGLN